MALNKIILIGRLTKDVELKTVGNDTSLANFTLAVDRRYKSKNEEQRTADFIPVSAWRKTAEFAGKYFHKGKQVYVCGALETYTYEQNGEKKFGFRVNAEEVGFADSVGNGDNKQEKQSNSNTGNGSELDFADVGDFDFGDPNDFEDDLPF